MGQPIGTIGVFTDIGCEPSPQLLERFKSAVVPVVVYLGTESYVNGELPAGAFWRKAAPETSISKSYTLAPELLVSSTQRGD